MDEATRVCTDLGHRVIELRRERGWTQEQLAERSQLDERDVRRIEAGENTTVHTLVRVAHAFRVSIALLFEPPSSRAVRRLGRPAAPRSLPAAAES
ncbi:MAG: helix-turn-helix domain-containing protein, partial [Polyangiaceae bacterium]